MTAYANLRYRSRTDGVSYTPALHGILGKQQVEQSFVLSEPVAARFAQLQLLSSWNPQAQNQIGIGEFKVVAVAGSGVLTAPVNLADLDKGGHIVTSSPLMGDPTQILSPQRQQPLTGAASGPACRVGGRFPRQPGGADCRIWLEQLAEWRHPA